jgi:purine nucleosidase
MNRSPESIILDTDIGSDIDDALALAYLLRQPSCKLAGITTVTGEPARRAHIADALCSEAGRPDIPIHVGAAKPLLVQARQTAAPHADAIDAIDANLGRAFDERQTAIDFLSETIRANPGQIALLAIGPLTNIALLLQVDPEIPTLLKRLVLMGGQFAGWAARYKAVAEWNIFCDPHAAAMVFAADIDILAIGLDITTQCSMPAAECRQKLAEPGIPKMILPMAEIWLQHAPQVVFHDPLAAAVIFDPELCTYQRGAIEVELTSDRAAGMTYWTPNESGRHVVATSVDSARFFSHYFATMQPMDARE